MSAPPCPPDGPSQLDQDPAAEASSLLETLAQLWGGMLARYQARIELVSLDVRRASVSLTHIIVLSMLCAFVLWTAWFSTMAALMAGVGHLTGNWAWGFAAVIGLNLGLARWLWRRAMGLTHHLTLPDVRAHLLGSRDE